MSGYKKRAKRVDSQNSFENESSSSTRHPPHLRGRQIGLFYAQKNKARREKEGKPKRDKPVKPIGAVVLSDNKKEQIQQLLNSTSEQTFIVDDGTYSHVEDSAFKRSFLRIIHGDIADKLNSSCTLRRDKELDARLSKDLEYNKRNNILYRRLLLKRHKLPSYDKRDEILKFVEENQVVVISGETGCGKTTQVPQFILDDHIENNKGSVCHIVCTQPRRISAISVAERVAEERGEKLGESVGFHIRLEK